MLKHLGKLFLAGLAIFSTTGCIQMEHEFQIATNGSGVYNLKFAISEQAISQFAAAFKLRNDLATAAGEIPPVNPDPVIMTFINPSATSIRAMIDEWKTYGVTLREINENTRAFWRDFSITLDINDIGRLQEIPFFAEYGFSLNRNADGHYVLDRPALVQNADEIPPRFSDTELEQIRPFLAGSKNDISIEVPGRIISTTAHRTALQTAIWSFDFNRQPEAMHQLMKQQLYIVFHAPGIDLPAIRIPTSNL